MPKALREINFERRIVYSEKATNLEEENKHFYDK